ncbi:MAG: STAS/SEC14 domain-containing protein [Syntrophotaleaceae bacterium]
MFKITLKGADRLDIEMSGRLNSDEMKIVLDELESKSKHIVNGKMLYDVIEFHLPSLGAIGLELARMPSMWKVMKKFQRAAVLTDKTWIKKVSELEGLFLPGLEIKAFDRDRIAEAEAWLAG